jgi:asparagine N-glycosylation enzyme membrane subunit Stt3
MRQRFIKLSFSKKLAIELVYLAILLVIAYTNYFILSQTVNVNRIKVSANKSIPMLTNVDGFWYYRLLEYLYYNHTIPHHDPLRAYPKGATYNYVFAPITFNMQYLTLLLIPIYGSPWYAAIYAPVVYAVVTMILVYFFVRRLTRKNLAALVAASLFVFSGIGLYRYSAGFYDHDIFCVMYLVILLWTSYEFLYELDLTKLKDKKTLAKLIFLVINFVFWYASFIDSSATYRAYLIILSIYLFMLPFSEIEIPLRNLLALFILVLLSPIFTAKYGANGRIVSYLKDFATIIFAISIIYYIVILRFKQIYAKKLESIFQISFPQFYLLIFLIAIALVTWAAIYGPLKSKVVVIKQIGIARTIAEWQPLIDWNLFFKAPLLAIHGMLVNLSHYYAPAKDSHAIIFWLALLEATIFLLTYIAEFTTRKIRIFDSNKGLVYYTLITLGYFLLAIVVGVQGVRLLSLFPLAVTMAFSLAFVFVDERSMIEIFLKPIEALKTSDIARGIYSIALVAFFVWLYYSYASSSYSITSKAWFAAINQVWYDAMQWIAHNTPKAAAFDFWWDYGYWVQTLGRRPTLTDGGHAAAIKDFDYYNAYHVFLGNLRESHDFLKKFNASYLLISWQEIGKWGAISYNAEYFANTFLHKRIHLFSAILPCILYQQANQSYNFICAVGSRNFVQVTVHGSLEHPSNVNLTIPGEFGSASVGLRYYLVSRSSGLKPEEIRYPANATVPAIFVLSAASYMSNPRLAYAELQGAIYYPNALGGYLIISSYGLDDNLFDVDRVANSTFVQLFLLGNNETNGLYNCAYSCNRFAIPVWSSDGFLGYVPVVKIWFVA